MSAILTIAIPAASLAGSIVALIWARRAIAKAERIRASTESVDRLEMHRIAREEVRRARSDNVLPFHPWRPSAAGATRLVVCDGPLRTFTPTTGNPPPDAHGWMS